MALGALPWVSPALGAHLEQIRGRLDALRDPTAVTALEEQWAPVICTLRLAGFQLGDTLAGELEQLTRMLVRGTAGCRGDILRSLVLGLVGLETQFKRARPGQHETTLSLLGLIDDARAVRKLPPLSGETLFFPGLDKPIPPRNAPDVGVQHCEPEDLARELHPIYREGLASLAQDPLGEEGAASLYGVAARLQGACDTTEGKRLWWLVAGLCEALREAKLFATPAVRGLLTRIEPEIARLGILGEARFNARLPKTLLRNLLFRIALIPGMHGQAGMIKRAYQLEDLLPGTTHVGTGGESLELAVFENLRQRVCDTTVKIRHQLEALGRSRRYRPELYEHMAEPLAQIADAAAMLGEVAASEQLESLAIRTEAIATSREDAHDRGIWSMVAVLFRVEKRMAALKGRSVEGNTESSLFPDLPDFRLDALTGALGMVDSVRELLRGRVRGGAERFALEAIWALRRAAQFSSKAEDDMSTQWLGSLASWLNTQPRDTLLARPELQEFATVLACVWCRLDAGVSGRKYPRDPTPVAIEGLKRLGVYGTAASSAANVVEALPPTLVQPVIPLHLPDADSILEDDTDDKDDTIPPLTGPNDMVPSPSVRGDFSMAKERQADKIDKTIVPPSAAAEPQSEQRESSVSPPEQPESFALEPMVSPLAAVAPVPDPDKYQARKAADVEVPPSENLEDALDLLESLVEEFEGRALPDMMAHKRRPPRA